MSLRDIQVYRSIGREEWISVTAFLFFFFLISVLSVPVMWLGAGGDIVDRSRDGPIGKTREEKITKHDMRSIFFISFLLCFSTQRQCFCVFFFGQSAGNAR